MLLLAVAITAAPAATAQIPSSPDTSRPLPDIPTLMHEVEAHQRASEAIQKDYLYHEVAHQQRNDGKNSDTREYDVFWLRGVEIHKLTRKDGRELTADEQRKEDERIDKEVAKAQERKRKADAKGQETNSRGNDEITVSRVLTLGTFSNPRRVQLNGRDTIAIDYTGDPKAKTRNRLESAIRDLSGTLWVDEQDRVLTRTEGHFAKSFKIGAGMLISIKEGTSFSMEWVKINQEVWLPSHLEGRGGVRMLLFVNFDGSVQATNSNYRKFKATSTILPGLSTVKESPSSENPPKPENPEAPAPH
ncbi:MAG TPA: hypothetical protein VK596_04725 [Edaphobacter sp.]|nr:hypothetical protein [Edaphobacter sp.]